MPQPRLLHPLFAVQQHGARHHDQRGHHDAVLRVGERKGEANRQQHEHQEQERQLSFGTAVLSFYSFFEFSIFFPLVW